MSAELMPLHAYPLGDDPAERERLVAQYVCTKKAFGWTSPIPQSVDIDSVSNVIDIAAGTCVWLLDLAHSPDVKPRLLMPALKQPENKINLYACDLTLTKFPPKEYTDGLGIQTFQQDVTKPFPAELYGTFDLVHMSLVVLALTEDSWKKALVNCRDLLKPGGTLWLIENDPVFHSQDQPLSTVVERGHDLEGNMNGSTWRHKYNCVYTGSALRNGTFTNLSFCMPSLLQSVSMQTMFSQKCIAPFGKLCAFYPALADEDESTALNSDMLFGAISAALLKKGILEVPRGTKIMTEEIRQQLAAEVQRGVREDGAYIILFEFVVKKA